MDSNIKSELKKIKIKKNVKTNDPDEVDFVNSVFRTVLLHLEGPRCTSSIKTVS